ncbi:hypothetical protein BKA65DRAFT_75515 [Rhexocercosporidium sp. MPI-PUGE-AT-0058]|nr:hypothetical protein BKA65DRAFT_75515 [Rhexocercosporidium sp. MPI-PUGE-AT-0058]
MEVPVPVPVPVPAPVPPPPDPSSILSSLYSTGQYSDLTITCQGHAWHVHRAVVCVQSEPLAAAVSGSFKEAKTGTIDLDNRDPKIVSKFLYYLYHGDYSDNRETIPKKESLTTASQPARTPKLPVLEIKDSTATTDANTNSNPPNTILYDPFLLNIKMFALADYFSVLPLKTLSLKKFQATVLECWNTSSFVSILSHLHTKNEMYERDDKLRKFAVRVAGRNAGVLQDRGEFVELCRENAEVGWAVLKVALNEGQAVPVAKKCPWFPMNWQHTVTFKFDKGSYWCEACCKYYK